MRIEKVYLGLGANLGEPIQTLTAAVKDIEALPGISDVKLSCLYQTSPVSDIPQDDYINAACSLVTTLSPIELKTCLQDIEQKHGKGAKAKDAPRYIDIDILLYGSSSYDEGNLVIPHVGLLNRLFVLRPLLDLTDAIPLPRDGSVEMLDLKQYLETFSNPHDETVIPINGVDDEKCVNQRL